jgi:hypothetical protein
MLQWRQGMFKRRQGMLENNSTGPSPKIHETNFNN